MTFHNHLHEQTHNEDQLSYIIVIGHLGMVFSLIGNIKQTYEMYPLFLHDRDIEENIYCCIVNIPGSFMFAVCSDVCLIIYGIVMNDMIIIGYAGLNTLVIVIVMFKNHREHQTKSLA